MNKKLYSDSGSKFMEVSIDNEQTKFIILYLKNIKILMPELSDKGHVIIDSIKLRFELANTENLMITTEEAYYLCVFLQKLIDNDELKPIGRRIALQIIINIHKAFEQYDKIQRSKKATE